MSKTAFRRRPTAPRLGQVELYLTVREVLFLAQPQMACCRASAAVLAVSGLQR